MPRSTFKLILIAVTSVGILFSTNLRDAISQQNESTAQDQAPDRHIRIPDASYTDGEGVEKLYQSIRAELQRGYAVSDHPTAMKYQTWQRYNRMPFRSAGHGRRFVSTYANATAEAYGKFEAAGKLPIGSIIAKDSIVIRKDGHIAPDVLTIMEKMPDGFNDLTGNWRYTEITPDGAVLGTTNGKNDKQVDYCIACHLIAEDHDHLRFMPKRYRR